MCDATAILMGGMAITDHMAQSQQAKMQDAMWSQNRVNAIASMRDQYQQTQLRMQQESKATAHEVQQRQAMMLREMSTANVAAGEAGVTGLSVGRIFREIGGLASNDIGTLRSNRDMTLSQLSHDMKGQRASTINQINSVQKGQHPSLLGTMLKIGAAGVGGWDNYAKANEKTTSTQFVKGLFGR